MLHPQDILVTLKLLSATSAERATYAAFASAVLLSASETHAAVQRALKSGLILPSGKSPALAKLRPSTPAIHDLLCFGLRYLLPAEPGRIGPGLPTATSAPPLLGQIRPMAGFPHVSPHPKGSARGQIIEPIYKSAPAAALRDPQLAEWLALADALRLHYGRIADLARQEIRARLDKIPYASA